MKTRSLLASLVLALVLLPAPARAGTLVADWHMDTSAWTGATDPNCPPPTPDDQFPDCKYYTTPDAVNGFDVGPYYRGGFRLAAGRWGSAVDAFNNLMLQRQLSDGVPQPTRLTVMAWVRHNGYPGSIQYIVGQGDDGATCSKASWALYTASSGVAFYISPHNQNPVLSPTMTAQQSASLWDGNWHMVAGTYDESKVRLYVDGQQIGSGTSTPFPTLDYFTMSHENLYMDGFYPSECGGGKVGGSHDYTGDLDETRIYGRALRATELARMQADSGGTQPPVLVPDPPVVHTTGADQLTNSGARVNGTIDDYGTTSGRVDGVSYHVDYGTTTAYGHSSSTFQTDGSGLQTVHVPLSGLTPGTTYHARLVAGSSNQSGGDITFTTPSLATLALASSSFAVAEGQGQATLSVQRSGDTSQAVSAHWATSDGTAQGGSDYSSAFGTVSFAAGETTKNISLTIFDDAAHESDETFTVSLSSPSSNAALGSPSQAQVKITDNDALPTTTIALDPATPPAGGVYKTPVKVTVTGSGHAPVETRCVLDPAQAPAAFSDMPAGCSVSGSTVSAPGTHKVYAASRDSAGTGALVSRTFTITYDPPTVHTTGADQITNTGARVNGTIDDHGNPVAYHVDYGTTTAYGHSSTTVATSGTGAQTVHVALTGLSPGTTYHARLVAGSVGGEDISFKTTNLAVLHLKTAAVTLGEGQGPATVAVERLGDTSQAVTVHYATSDGTAKAGSDYTSASGTLNFAAGDTTKNIAVTIVDDAPHEADETLTLALSSPSSNAALGSPSQAQIQITDNDPLPQTAIALDPADPSADGAYRGTVKFSATGSGRDPVETRCVLDPGSAPASFDAIPPGCPSGSAVGSPGSHAVFAASRDSAGAGAVVSRSFTIAAPIAPDTTIVDAPSGTIWTAQSLFAFTSTVAGSTFECRIDGGDFIACSSPIGSAPLASGPHTFEVRAIGPDGVADPSPAAASFTVGTPSTEALGCHVDPVVFGFGEGLPVQFACSLGRKPSTNCGLTDCTDPCAPGWLCTWEEHDCPVGAECVAVTRGDYHLPGDDPDMNFEVLVAFRDTHWDPSIRADGYATCLATGSAGGCGTTATARVLGTGAPFLTWCRATPVRSTDPLGAHPDQRHIGCAGTLSIKMVAPLATLTDGTTTQILAPSAGTLDGTGTVTGGTRRTVAAAAVPRPRVAAFHRHVRSRGPVTVHLKLNRAAKRQLRRRHRLPIRLRITFTPDGAEPVTRTKRLTLRTVRPSPCRVRRTKHGKIRKCLGA